MKAWHVYVGVFWAFTASNAAAGDEMASRFYGDIHAGASFLSDWKLGTTQAQVPDVIVVRSDTGWSTSAAVGYRVSEPLRLSLDLDRFSHSFTGTYIRAIQPRIACLVNGVSGRCPDPGAHGRIGGTSVLAGIHYDLALSQRWAASAGLGLGLAVVHISATSEPATVLPTPVALLDTGDSAFAVAGSGEILYRLSTRLSLIAGYRYLHAGRLQFDATTGRAPYASDRALSSHVIRVGLRQSF
jgi:opacity protein-like surface antigen